MITQKIILNLIPNGVPPRINVSQYDMGSRILEFHLINGYSDDFTIPAGSDVFIEGTKKDKTVFAYQCKYSGSDVTCNITRQMTILKGDVECELVIIDSDNNILGSANFVIYVENAAVDDGSISESDVQVFNDYILQMKEIKKEAVSEAETISKSWAVGGTGTRTGEDTDNSKYYCNQASMQASDAADSASQAAMYAGITMPSFYLNIEDGYLYQKEGVDIDFKVDEDAATLYVKIGG